MLSTLNWVQFLYGRKTTKSNIKKGLEVIFLSPVSAGGGKFTKRTNMNNKLAKIQEVYYKYKHLTTLEMFEQFKRADMIGDLLLLLPHLHRGDREAMTELLVINKYIKG